MPFPLEAAAVFGLVTRAATDADMPFLCTLYGTTRADELAMTGWPEATKSLFVVQQFSAQHGEYVKRFADMERLVVERDGAAIGRCYVSMTGSTYHLIDIALMPEARARGYGASLLADLMACAAARGKSVTLSVLSDNPALRLYRRLGFAPTGADVGRISMEWQPQR